MSILKKCDICGKEFDFGFSLNISLQGGMSFTNVSEHRFELGQKDVCTECYYSIKNALKETAVKNELPPNIRQKSGM